MASSDPSRKRGREEVPSPTEPEEVPPPPPEEVPLPPPEEVKRLKPPRRKVPICIPSINVEDACFSVKMLYQTWQSLKKMVVHLGVQRPLEPLQTTVMDYAFKVNVLVGHLETEVPPPPDDDDDGSLDVSSSGSDFDSDSDGGAPPAATTSA
jgi:hypothetical protein